MDNKCCFIKPYKKVTHVIFDMDGTLLNSEKLYDVLFNDLAKEYGKTMVPSVHEKLRGSTTEVALKVFKDGLKIDADMDELVEKFMEMSRERLGDVELCDGVDKLVRHLAAHKIPMAVATSSNKEEFELKTAKHEELFGLFHHIVCGDDPAVYKSKPNPCIFLTAAERFPDNPAPGECLVFEDSINGMKGGMRAGMQVIMVPSPTVSYEDWKQATVRINSLTEAPLILFDLPPLNPQD